MNKRQSESVHAKLRAAQRYGLTLNKEKLQSIVKIIQSGRAIFVEKQSLRISVFDVQVEDKVCRVVYDRNRHQVVTFLPNPSHEVS